MLSGASAGKIIDCTHGDKHSYNDNDIGTNIQIPIINHAQTNNDDEEPKNYADNGSTVGKSKTFFFHSLLIIPYGEPYLALASAKSPTTEGFITILL